MSAAYGLKEGTHINVDILANRMSPRTKIPMETISFALISAYSLILFIFALQMCVDAFVHNERDPGLLAAPMYLVELGMVIGTFLLSLQSFRMLVVKIVTWCRGNLESAPGILNRLGVVLPVYLILAVISVWLYIAYPAAGVMLSMLVLLFAGVPVFTALGVVGSVGLLLLMGPYYGLQQTAAIGLKAMNSNVLLAIPLYILCGQIISDSGIGKELYSVGAKWVGHIPGGLAVTTIGACAFFAAISGSSVATSATIGIIAIPEMLKRNYEPTLVYGVLAAGGTLGILIPPSAAMIIYSAVTEESTGALFMGGIIPGIILAIIFAAYAVFSCVRSGRYEKLAPASWKDRFLVLKTSVWGLLTPVLILVTIYTGICTPTESAAVAVIYVLVVSMFRGQIHYKQLTQTVSHSIRSSTMILMIVVGAIQVGMISTFLQLPEAAIDLVKATHASNLVIMLLLCVIYFILGLFLEVVSILLITMPIVYPLIMYMNLNGIWFGVFIVLLMQMALITPPVGLNVYVVQGIADAEMTDVIKGVIPFMLLILLGMVILWLFPDLATWLPGTMNLGGL
jgi:C4-dicarboxylate transporter DctM subunit